MKCMNKFRIGGESVTTSLSTSRVFEMISHCPLDSPLGGESIIDNMMIGQPTASTKLSVRTLRFYADAGVLPVTGRTTAGYRVFGPVAVARA